MFTVRTWVLVQKWTLIFFGWIYATHLFWICATCTSIVTVCVCLGCRVSFGLCLSCFAFGADFTVVACCFKDRRSRVLVRLVGTEASKRLIEHSAHTWIDMEDEQLPNGDERRSAKHQYLGRVFTITRTRHLAHNAYMPAI